MNGKIPAFASLASSSRRAGINEMEVTVGVSTLAGGRRARLGLRPDASLVQGQRGRATGTSSDVRCKAFAQTQMTLAHS
ncbi:MAG: hypothetical protein WCO55_00040 [Candidatus Falkowbacteria bacterium]